MIRGVFFASLLFFALFLNAKTHDYHTDKRVYIIQLFALPKGSLTEKEVLKRVPLSLRDKIHIHKIDNKLIGCYAQADSYRGLKKLLKKVKKAGYKGAYIRRTKVCLMRNRSQNAELTIVKKEKKLSNYKLTELISKANSSFEKHLYDQAVRYYEELLEGGFDNKNIRLNLSYLYGIFGKWHRFGYMITSKKYPTVYVYAYATGALKSRQKNFYKNLKNFIKSDYSGHLDLLAGYYFEQNKNNIKALKFYKSAYQKNPNDIYNKYAYARILDIIGKKDEAYKLYKEIYYATTQDSGIHKTLAKILD